jgi:hypothetical protein
VPPVAGLVAAGFSADVERGARIAERGGDEAGYPRVRGLRVAYAVPGTAWATGR